MPSQNDSAISKEEDSEDSKYRKLGIDQWTVDTFSLNHETLDTLI